MFRLLLRSLAINVSGIYIAVQVLSGVLTYSGGAKTLLTAALFILVANLFVRPLINLLLLPVHLITMGMFRWVANLAVLYLATRFIPQIHINSFTSTRLELPFIIIPSIHFSAFGAFIFSTIVLTVVFHFLYWLFQD